MTLEIDLSGAASTLERAPDPAPESLPIAAPRPGRSLGGLISAIHAPVRRTISILSAHGCPNSAETLLHESTRLADGGIAEAASVRFAWFLVGASLLHALAHKDTRVSPLQESLSWFMKDENTAQGLEQYYGAAWRSAEEQLSQLTLDDQFWALLPYVLEPDGHVTRSEFESCGHSQERKEKKRSAGVFYTPSDVAAFMVGSAYKKGGRWLDPACGSGVFLVAALDYIRAQDPAANLLNVARQTLFGIDRSALSTDLSALVLLGQVIKHQSVESPISH